jgi:hypothetical protein
MRVSRALVSVLGTVTPITFVEAFRPVFVFVREDFGALPAAALAFVAREAAFVFDAALVDRILRRSSSKASS